MLWFLEFFLFTIFLWKRKVSTWNNISFSYWRNSGLPYIQVYKVYERELNSVYNNNNSIQFVIIYVPSQQPQGCFMDFKRFIAFNVNIQCTCLSIKSLSLLSWEVFVHMYIILWTTSCKYQRMMCGQNHGDKCCKMHIFYPAYTVF
jgi:hypothetical protein